MIKNVITLALALVAASMGMRLGRKLFAGKT